MSSTTQRTFGIARAVLGSPPFLEIDIYEYQLLGRAKSLLTHVLAIEEKYDLVTANYIELETTLNDMAVDHLMRDSHSYQSLHDCRVLLNRRVQNLLSSCRLYLDHAAYHVSALEDANAGLASAFNMVRTKQYDDSAAYRIAEALRNHAQHRGFPISGISLRASNSERPDSKYVLLYRVEMHLDIEAIRESGKVKQLVLDDLADLGDAADARPLFREYVSCISTVHDAIRSNLQDSFTTAEAAIELAIKRYQDAFPAEDSTTGLAMIERASDGTWLQHSSLFMDIINRRRQFQLRNPSLVNLKIRHVSSEP
jgi:hypothetical protein